MDNTTEKSNREESLKHFKTRVRQWMREHKKSAKWLADKINKAEGSVKNWLYSSLNITDENQRAIENVMLRYEQGGYVCPDSPKKFTPLFIAINLFSSTQPNSDILLPEYPFWCNAAVVSPSIFTCRMEEDISPDFPEKGYANRTEILKLANWATSAIMRHAAAILQKEYDSAKTDEEKQEKIKKRFSEFSSDGGSRTEEILPGNTIRGTYDLIIRYYEKEDEEPRMTLYLPVIEERWKGIYAELAANISRKSTHAWIVETLNREARKDSIINLGDFLAQMGNTPEEDTVEDEIPEIQEERNDDIPF